jgi:hypothetical protein
MKYNTADSECKIGNMDIGSSSEYTVSSGIKESIAGYSDPIIIA